MKHVSTLKELEYLGEAALLGPHKRGATVLCEATTETLALSRETFNSLVSSNIIDNDTVKTLANVAKRFKEKDLTRRTISIMGNKAGTSKIIVMQLKRSIKSAKKVNKTPQETKSAINSLASVIQKYIKSSMSRDNKLLQEAFTLFENIQKEQGGDPDPLKYEVKKSLNEIIHDPNFLKKATGKPSVPQPPPPPPSPDNKKSKLKSTIKR